MAADGYAGSRAFRRAVPRAALRGDGTIPFRVRLTLAGSSQLTFLPLARKADITLKSAWPHPKFEGAPAPLDPSISDRGFTAKWSVLEINRNFGQSWFDDQVRAGRAGAARPSRRAASACTFYEPVDVYQRNYRAVHYAVLLIVITFLTFFLWEHVSGLAIHAMQYLMVGLALALFYLLLLALSEHVSFDLAYGVSAGALVRLITVYLTGVLGRLRLALGAGAGLATLYTHAVLDPALRGLLAAHGRAAAVRRAGGAHAGHAPRRLVECRAAAARGRAPRVGGYSGKRRPYSASSCACVDQKPRGGVAEHVFEDADVHIPAAGHAGSARGRGVCGA